MFDIKKLSLGVRKGLLIAGSASLLTMPQVSAQTVEESEETEPTERIQVTGSRIKRVDLEAVSPVTVITAESIELSGDTTVADVLRNSSISLRLFSVF